MELEALKTKKVNSIIKQNDTHKAVKDGKFIKIYLKGTDKKEYENTYPDSFQEDVKNYPHWFKDELLYTIPLENVDDLFAYFERFEEDMRCLINEVI